MFIAEGQGGLCVKRYEENARGSPSHRDNRGIVGLGILV